MAQDLDALLQSHGEIDSDEETSGGGDRHHRTVDEILLNHSSSSPSPPSSPSTSYSNHHRIRRSPKDGDGEGKDGVLHSFGSYKSQRLLHSHSSSLVESVKYNLADGSVGSFCRTNHDGRVLPQLFGGGVIRSSAKPGAALAAAAAASRSIPTPHATAIKLRRATTSDLRRSVSEATENIAGSDDSSLSPSNVAFRESENGSDAGNLEGLAFSGVKDRKAPEEEEVHLQQCNSESICFDSEKVDGGAEISAEDGLLENPDKPAEVSTSKTITEASGEDDEYGMPDFNSRNGSHLEEEKDLALNEIEVRGQVLSQLLDEKSEELPAVSSADDSVEKNAEIGRATSMSDVDGNEDASEGEDVREFHNVMDEHANVDDTSSQTYAENIPEDLVSLTENERDAAIWQQKSHSLIKPLDLAEENEKKQAFTGLHYEEGAVAQPMRLEGVRSGSTVLGYFDVNSKNAISRTISPQAFRRDHGSPQVLASHFNYIAVGMSKGSIFILPSKYTTHQDEIMDGKMTSLGLQGDRSHVPVTSMCFNQQGDLLFAGYGDGHYTVWDVQKTSALKVVTEHKAPVVHMLYLGQDTQVTRQFIVVSGDSKGVVKLIRFTVVPWLNRISYTKPMKLLDETTSRVVCASPLLYGDGGNIMSSQSGGTVSASSISSMMGGMVDEGVVIFITHQSALVAKVSPSVEVYAQIPKPDGVREGSMPYAAWRCMPQSPGSPSENAPNEMADKVSLLAIAWDQKIQVAKLLKSELKVIHKWTVESAAIGLAWLGDQMLAILTLPEHLYLYAKDGNLIHRTSFSADGFQGDDLISYHIYFSNALGNPEKAYHNSVAVRGTSIYILGLERLVVCRLLSWKERIEVLRKAGDWMGALNMAISLYDGKSHGFIDLPKNLDDIQRSVMPYLVELLQSYVNEVFSYMSVACDNQNSKLEQSDDIKEQFTSVGGVAVEFCVHIKRTDILFDDILAKFDNAQHKETFLELLEPYILKDMLGSLPPEVMQALVEHYSKRGWLQRIEQCVLHMDILSLDFNQVVRLCREHSLHCALVYLFNKGLDDFRTPLEELLVVLRNSTRENASFVGYRMLVYLKYCFQGVAFPPGHGNLSPTRLPSLRKELLQFLLEDSSSPNSWAVTSLPSNGAHANLLHLLELDTEATLEVLKFAFTDLELPETTQTSHETANFNLVSAESQKLVQKVVEILSCILDASYFQTANPSCSDINTVEIWPSKKDVGHMYEFIAYYVAYERANISRDILSQILEYLTSEANTPDTVSGTTRDVIKHKEKLLLSLLKVVPETHWDAPYLLHLSEKAQCQQVCGYIHAIRHQYIAALDSYLKAVHEPVYAFSYIHDILRLLSDEEFDTFESAVISRIPDLIKLSREGTYLLIIDHFSGKTQNIMSELQTQPESLFCYLKTVIEVYTTGTLNLSYLKKVDILDFPSERRAQQQLTGVQAYLEAISSSSKLLHNHRVNVTDEMTELYFELLCRYDRGSVLRFLETSESYRVEHCLRLCQEYGIIDAASFLLERVGDVGSALALILSNLNEKFVVLDAEIRKAFSNTVVRNLNVVMKKKVVSEILDIVHACIGLCQRNSPRLDPEESEYLWFQLLDSFCEPLMDSENARTDSEPSKKNFEGSVGESGDGGCKFKLKVSKNQKGAQMMRKMFSIFIKEIVEGMIGYVRLPRIMLKLLSDNGDQEFGDFKLTILGMLGIYDFEKRILDTAKSLIEDDTYYTMSLLRKGASHGYAPRTLVCCICNSFLGKYSSDSSIQVFSCGHAMHIHCENRENVDSFRGTLLGCPVCTPRKKAQRSSGKSKHAENGLVSRSSMRVQPARGTPALYPHDHEFSEGSYGSHQPSRFELLHNLEKDQKLIQLENMPQLRLAPPALYHEKVKKGISTLAAESSSPASTSEKQPKKKQLRDVKVKGSSVRFPLKANIFGKEKISRR